MSERVRKRVVVSGIVQGVWYRSSTVETARRLNVDGWVRNLPDGSVEAVFEGTPSAVDAVVEWSRIGPDRAIVQRVEVAEEQPEGLSGFRVAY
ncbi:MAG: acylphosphatase [Coriobacteriia bacterium]|nr:acylphosphatase [Coriobacteriia bacterium]